MSSLRRSARTRSVSSLRPTASFSQPAVRVMEPSPTTLRTASRIVQPSLLVERAPRIDQAQTQPIPMANVDLLENANCPLCPAVVAEDDLALCCDMCVTWYHANCLLISTDEYSHLRDSTENWFCDHCRSIRANKIKWGRLESEETIHTKVKSAYKEIITWKKNLFFLPRGKSGTDFLKELTRLIYLFVDKTKWQRIALSLVHIFVPLMLQKPCQRSKARDHAKYLALRLDMWKNGELDKLISEGKEIQKRMLKKKQHANESNTRAFCRLMFAGKVKQATKFIDSADCVKGVHKITSEVKQALTAKHPKAEGCSPDALLAITKPLPNPVIFEQITPELIQRCSKFLTGSGGPTLIDADSWKHFLCSRAYGKHTYHLAEAVSGLAKRLCSEKIHADSLQELSACRLIPLDKGPDKDGNPGIRPIGIGEVLRRIIGKAVMSILKLDVQRAGGCLQTCTGIRSGIEEAIHATYAAWNLPNTECLLQVDADNAFNRLNRKVALHNIREICPPLETYLFNHYQTAAPLYVNNDNKQQEMFLSEEGCTQGDPSAMGFYALGVKPLVDSLAASVDKVGCKQAWYADDSSATGKLKEVKDWWLQLNKIGPKFGYYPKASKSVLILKDQSLLPQALHLFAGCNIQITCDGERHLGAVVGTEDFKYKYVTEKVNKWVQDVKSMAKVAQEEPQAALSAYTKSICHRWVFVQRTVPKIKHLFVPLEDSIRQEFIPAIVGRTVSDEERSLLSLPVRLGGLGIANPTETADREYEASCIITEDLANFILRQEQDLSLYDSERTAVKVKHLKAAKETFLTEKFNKLYEETSDCIFKRCMLFNKEKGAGSWLTALPLKDHGYCLETLSAYDTVGE